MASLLHSGLLKEERCACVRVATLLLTLNPSVHYPGIEMDLETNTTPIYTTCLSGLVYTVGGRDIQPYGWYPGLAQWGVIVGQFMSYLDAHEKGE